MRPIVYGLQGLALIFLGLGLAGCAAGAGWAGGVVVLLSMSALFLAGCTETHGQREDAGVIETDSSTPPGEDAGGYWAECCQDGVVTTCFCPAGLACNYGWFETCADGSCAFTAEECPGDADGGIDAGNGTWEPCCQGGEITTCFCPAGAECNYGWYTDCGNGTCVDPASSCPAPTDAGAPDAGGYWEPCCVDGSVTTCFCPAGLACNYGWYTDCGAGVCVNIGETCPP